MGRLARIELFFERDQALEAAGLAGVGPQPFATPRATSEQPKRWQGWGAVLGRPIAPHYLALDGSEALARLQRRYAQKRG